MPAVVWLINVVVLVVVLSVAAMLVVFMAAFAITAMLVAFVLHKLGWDRRLIAYLMNKRRGGATPFVKVRLDDLDAPIDSRWADDEPIDAAWTVIEPPAEPPEKPRRGKPSV